MTTKRRTRAGTAEDKAMRRDEILAAAKRAFASRGFHSTKISDVAAEAALSYGAVYWYFDSKDELYDAVLANEEVALRQAILASLAADSSADTEKAIRRAIAGTFDFFDSDPAAVRLMFRPRGAGDSADPSEGLYGRFAGDIEALIVDAQDEGLMAKGDAGVIAFALAALIGQFAVRRLTQKDSMTPDDLAGFVLALVLDGIRSG